MKQERIKNIVLELISKEIMFTSYDITKIIRKDIEYIRHSNVNNVVKNMYSGSEMPNYIREQIDVGEEVNPYLYFNVNSDPSTYNKNWVENNINSEINQLTQFISTPTNLVEEAEKAESKRQTQYLTTEFTGLPNEYILKNNKDGRIEIPLKIANKAFGTICNKIFQLKKETIVVDGIPKNMLVIKDIDPSSPTSLHQVDSKHTICNAENRIRFSSKKYIGNIDQITASIENNSILIKI